MSKSTSKTINIPVYTKMQETKDGKRKFRVYWTRMRLLVEGQEDKGKQDKSVQLKFSKDCPNVSNITSSGVLVVPEDKFSAPYKFRTTDDYYPVVWVNEFAEFIPNKSGHSQDDFVIQADTDTEDDEPTNLEE